MSTQNKRRYTVDMKGLDAAEKDANKRFEALKVRGVACEQVIKTEQEKLADIRHELAIIQGEYRAIQNLRSKAGGAKELPAKPKR